MQGQLTYSKELTGFVACLYLQQRPAGMYALKIINAAEGYSQEEKIVLSR